MPARRLTQPQRLATLHSHAASLRAQPTLSEQALWQELKGSQLGVAFRRQLVLPPFIADFAAPSARLIVEVDGPYHSRRGRADARRDRALRQRGWHILRLSDELVLRRSQEAVRLIRAALEGALR